MRSIVVICLVISIISCNSETNPSKEVTAQNKDLGIEKKDTVVSVSSNKDLPFIGTRSFDTKPGFSGTGTPQRFIEIKKDGDVIFSFEQENQADGEITKETYNAGKFNKYMKCIFKKLDNESTYYEITKDTIYEVDKNNKRLQSQDCCDGANDEKKECVCKGEFLSTE